MTTLESQPKAPSPPIHPEPVRGRPDVLLAVVLGAALGAGLVLLIGLADFGGTDAQVADLSGQGASDATFASDASTLVRHADGVFVEMEIPVPTPGSYNYPTGDMVPPWAEPHPAVSPGASGAPEVFTVWAFTFNNPAACTDGNCDVDDLALDADAQGGAYQLDGRVGRDDTLEFAGGIRVGESPMDGSPLTDPAGAEVHLAIAPHGRALPGPDGWRQLNGPVGNPEFWWVSRFPADG